jgi:hypothetical protein
METTVRTISGDPIAATIVPARRCFPQVNSFKDADATERSSFGKLKLRTRQQLPRKRLHLDRVCHRRRRSQPEPTPSPTHFTTGRQELLAMVRELIEDDLAADFEEALFGPWRYQRALLVLGWDNTSVRNYTLRTSTLPKTRSSASPPRASPRRCVSAESSPRATRLSPALLLSLASLSPARYRRTRMPSSKPSAKKAPTIQASQVAVGNRTLEGVLIDLAEQVKANDARHAERVRLTEERLTRIEERSAEIEERAMRAEEMAAIALRTIAAVSQDLRAMTQELRDSNGRIEKRLDAIEGAQA